MHPRPKPAPAYYAEKIARIKADAAPVIEKIESGAFTWRDVAIITEYLQQYVDVLEEMENTPPFIVGTSLDTIAGSLEIVNG